MKFENIKVGDKVFIESRVRCGLKTVKAFWILSEVTRTTKTQFLVGDRRFKKDHGKEIGECYFDYARAVGDTDRYNKPIVDQSAEYSLFKEKVKTVNFINFEIYLMERTRISIEDSPATIKVYKDKIESVLRSINYLEANFGEA